MRRKDRVRRSHVRGTTRRVRRMQSESDRSLIRARSVFPAFDGGLNAPRCLNKALVPDLKHQQRPEQLAMIRNTAFVFVLQTRDVVWIEDAGSANPVG